MKRPSRIEKAVNGSASQPATPSPARSSSVRRARSDDSGDGPAGGCDASVCVCGAITAVAGTVATFFAAALILFHMSESFGAAATETIAKQVMPGVEAKLKHHHSDANAENEGDGSSVYTEYSNPNFLGKAQRSRLLHNSTAALLSAALDHLDALEVKGVATFETMHVLEDTHEGLVAEWTQRSRDGNLMCEWLGGLLEAYEALGDAADDAEALVLELCERKPSKAGSDGNGKQHHWVPRMTAYRHYYFHRPSLTKYGAHQWLWDSCFHIMAQVAAWRGGSSAAGNGVMYRPPRVGIDAEEEEEDYGGGVQRSSLKRHSPLYRLVGAILEFRSLMLFQNLETGFVPEMTYWHPDPNQYLIAGYLFGYSDKAKRFTDITQMPMLSFPLQRIVKAMRDIETALADKIDDGDGNKGRKPLHKLALAYFAPKVALYYKYWLANRYRDGLVSIVHPWESGLDASPMYDPFHDFCKDKLNTVAGSKNSFEDGLSPSRHGPSRTWYSTFFAIIDPTSAQCPPHPEDLYPKFISLLYRYRHANGWDLGKIRGAGGEWAQLVSDSAPTSSFSSSSAAQSEQPNRFEVQDVGVNAVLGYNMKLVLELLDDALRTDADGKEEEGNNAHAADGGTARHHRYAPPHSQSTREAHPHIRHKDGYRRFRADDILLASYEELFDSEKKKEEKASKEEGRDASVFGKALRRFQAGGAHPLHIMTDDEVSASHPIALSHSIADTFIKSVTDQCVREEGMGGSVSVISKGWSPKEGQFIETDATRVVQQFMLLLLLSPSANAIDAMVPSSSRSDAGHRAPPPPPNPVFTAKEARMAEHLLRELSAGNRFGSGEFAKFAQQAGKASADNNIDAGAEKKALVSLSFLLSKLEDDLERFRGKGGEGSAGTEASSSSSSSSSFTWGTPTTAVNDFAFVAEDSALMWRGPSWPTTNWYVLEGLRGLAERLRLIEAEEEENERKNDDERRSNQKAPISQKSLPRGISSAYVSNLRSNLLRSWTLLVHAKGFSEYYNPLSGEALGQKGLGMSLSLLDALWGES